MLREGDVGSGLLETFDDALRPLAAEVGVPVAQQSDGYRAVLAVLLDDPLAESLTEIDAVGAVVDEHTGARPLPGARIAEDGDAGLVGLFGHGDHRVGLNGVAHDRLDIAPGDPRLPVRDLRLEVPLGVVAQELVPGAFDDGRHLVEHDVPHLDVEAAEAHGDGAARLAVGA